LVESQEEPPPLKLGDEVLVWLSVSSEVFAYGSADATAILKPHHLLPHLHPDRFYLSGCPGKEAVERDVLLRLNVSVLSRYWNFSHSMALQ